MARIDAVLRSNAVALALGMIRVSAFPDWLRQVYVDAQGPRIPLDDLVSTGESSAPARLVRIDRQDVTLVDAIVPRRVGP